MKASIIVTMLNGHVKEFIPVPDSIELSDAYLTVWQTLPDYEDGVVVRTTIPVCHIAFWEETEGKPLKIVKSKGKTDHE